MKHLRSIDENSELYDLRKNLGDLGFGANVEIGIPLVLPYGHLEDDDWVEVLHTASDIKFNVWLPDEKGGSRDGKSPGISVDEAKGLFSAAKRGDFTFDPSGKMLYMLKGSSIRGYIRDRVKKAIEKAAVKIEKEVIRLEEFPISINHTVVQAIREELAEEFAAEVSQWNMKDLERQGRISRFANKSNVEELIDLEKVKYNMINPLASENKITKRRK